MASKSDGQIIIDSEIQTDGIQKDISEVKASVEKIVAQLDKLEKSFEDAFSGSDVSGAVSEQNKLQSELSKTSEDIKALSDEDKDLNAQMSKDVGSDKYDSLQKEISETEADLGSLADESKSTDAKLDSGDAGAGKYNKLQTEIGQTENDISGLKGAADSAASSVGSSADDMSAAFEGLNDTLDEVSNNTKLGNLMEATEQLSGAGEKVLDFAGSTIEMANDVQSATARVNGYFGLTGDAADEMAGVVENVFSSGITDSMDDVAEAVITVNNNIRDLDSASLENLTEQAIVLEQTMGSDMSETMRGVNALMTNFGLDAQTAMDLVVAGTQNGLDKTQELGDNLSEYSGKFAQAGYSAEEYFQLLSNGLEGGAYNLDKVNDSINEVTTRLSDGTIGDAIGSFSEKTQDLFTAWQNGDATQKQVIDSIVADIAGCTNQQDALNMAATAFGTMAEDGGLQAITALSSVGTTYDDVSGKAQALSDSTTTPMQELQAKINETKVALAPLGTTLLDLATTYLPPLINGIQSLINFFTGLPAPVQTAIVVAGLLTAGFLVLAPAISAVAIAMIALDTSLLPIIAVIAAVIAIITAVVLVIQNWGAITEWLGGVWDTVCAGLKSAWEGVKSFFSGIAEWWSGIWNTVVEVFSGIWDTIKNTVSTAMTAIQEAFTTAWNAILNNPVVQTIITTIQQLFQNMVTTLSGIWNGLVSIASGVWELIKNVVLAPVLLLIDLVTGDFDSLASDAKNIWNNIKNAASSIWSGIKQVVSSLAKGLANGVKTAINGLKSTLSSIWKSIKSTVSSVWNGIKSTVVNIAKNIKTSAVNAFKSMVSGIKSTISNIGSTIKNGFNSAIEFITSLPSKAIKWGKDIINGIVDGIKGAIGKVKDAASGVADSIRSFLHFSVPDEGPLADADEYMPDFIDLLVTGISRNIKKVKAVAEKTAAALQIPEYNVGLPYMAQGVIAPATTSIINYERNRTVTNNSTNYQINAQQYDRIITLLNKILATNNGILEKDTNTYMDGRRVNTVLKNVEKRKGYGFTR